MKLSDFLEELNQGAEKAFGENAQAMIDSLLYAKLAPPKLKRSVNMAQHENASDEEIVTHLERELELNGLEVGDDITVPTMSTAPTATRPGTGLLSSGNDPSVTCNYCKKPATSKMTAENSNERRNKDATTDRITKKNIQNEYRLRKYEPNVPLRDERPEGNLQPDEEIVIPQDNLYVITWETNFGDLQADHRNETYDQNDDRTTNSSDATEAVEQPGQILTDVDLRSTERTATDELFPNPILQEDDAQSFHDDKTSSGGSDTIVPEVL